MKALKLIYPLLLIFYANASLATSSVCLDFLNQNGSLSYVLNSDLASSLNVYSYMERIEKIGDEVARVNSLLEQNGTLVGRVLSKNIRSEHQTLQERLNILNKYIENLKEIEDTVYAFPVVDKAMDVTLTTRLLESRSLRRRLNYTNQRVRESKSVEEQNFTTAVSHHILYGEEFSFLTIPFSHWLTLNILHGRHAQGHFDYLNSVFKQTDIQNRDPDAIGELNYALAHSLMELDPGEVTAYTNQAVDGGLIVPQDKIVKSPSSKAGASSSRVTGSRDTPLDNYHDFNDQPPPSGTGIYDSDGGDMGGGGGPPP